MSTSVWLRPARVPRSRKGQAFTHTDIAAAAVRLADADGIDALSMRRVATELGITAMSLYWYVDTKDQVVELMVDRVFAAQAQPHGDDWRARLTAIGRASYTRYRAHPWFVAAHARPGSLPGPAQLRYWDTNVGALTDPALEPRFAPGEVTIAVGTVNHLASGYARSPLPGLLTPEEVAPDADGWFRRAVAEGGLDHLRALRRSLGGGPERLGDARFERELALVLDGVAGLLAR